MTRYTVLALPGGWIVAIRTATGRRIAVSDHATRASAEREAARLEAAWQTAESRRLGSRTAAAITERLDRLRVRVADLAAA